ncbi:MAG: Ig-like domain-containing protein, partial [Anaerolineales bacterium]|nr:Ig-like domain-containing protein [Anaerolineales bacterium]
MKRTYFTHAFMLFVMFTAVFTACGKQAQRTNEPTNQPTTAAHIEPAIEPTQPPTATAGPAIPVQFSGEGLEAVLYSETPLNDLFPDAPLTIYFSEPMNSNHSRPLIFSPSIAGEFSWNADNTILTFTPLPAFDNGRSYTVSVNAGLESRTGEKITPIQRWRLQMRTVPTVIRRIPNNTQFSQYTPTVKLRFNRQMDRASTQNAVTVNPPLAFETAWAGDDLQITLTEPMQFGKVYEFTLAETAVDTNGENLSVPYNWHIHLRDTMNGASWPTIGIPERPLTLNFNYPIDTTRLTTIATLDPAIDGEWRWNETHKQATFQPNGRFPTETKYTVTPAESLFDQAGNALPQPEPFTFTTPAAVLSATPGVTSAHPASPIVIQFDRPMNQAATETAVTIDPPTTGTFSWEENALHFVPENGYFQKNTQYTVTIAPTATGADGEIVLHDPYSWTFTTSDLAELASFGGGPNAQVIDENGRRAIQFQAMTVNAIKVSFELYQYNLEQFLPAYTTNFAETWWGDQTVIDTDDLRTVAQWEMETSKAVNEWENVQETILPDDIAPGLYVLNLFAGTLNDQIFVILSDSAITAKIADEQLVAWVTDINGDMLPNVPVQVYARDGRLLTTGSTNSIGVFESSLANFHENDTNDDTPMLVTATHDGKLTVTGLQYSWRSGGYWYWQSSPQPDAYAAYIYTDRPIYRPGQTVYFKAIVRQDDDAVLSLLPAGTAVSAQIRDARNNLVQTIDLRTNDFGTVNGEFAIADGAMLGAYHVDLVINGETHRQAFKVEDYRKPDYEVTVTTDREFAFKLDEIEITVDTRYFFDEPVANASVEINRFDLRENYDWTGQPGDYIWYKSYGPALRGTTDENGRFTATLRVPSDVYFNEDSYYYGSALQHITWGLEATVNDGSNQTVSDFAVVKIYNADEQIVVDHGGFSHKPDEPFTVRAHVTNLDDAPVADRNLTIELRRYNSSSYNYDIIVQTANMTTDAAGTAVTQLTAAKPGYYQLSVKGVDDRNHPIKYQSWLYIFDNDPYSWYGSSEGMRISADKETYAPGETAVLLIESQIDGPALLTIERGTVRREELVTLTPPITRAELPIVATDAPNIYVTVNAWEPQDNTLENLNYESVPDSRLRTASVNLSVPATDKQLTVTVTSDRESYAPGDDATFTVRVTNPAGVPVSAEVSMALVDDAIFALSEELSGPIYDGFYFERDNSVRTFHSMAPIRYLGGGFGGGGGGDESASPRQDFEDTAVWLPTLTTDFNGEATVTITLPDNLTRWRMTAKATTADTQVGETTATIVTQQDVLVRPLLPRILTAGDSLQLTTLVHNNTDQAQGLAVTLQEAGGTSKLSITAPITQTLLLEPGEVRAIGWSVTAVKAGTLDIIVTAHHNAGHPSGINLTSIADSVQLPLEIQPLAIPNVDVEIGQFTGAHTANITLPDDAMEMSTV